MKNLNFLNKSTHWIVGYLSIVLALLPFAGFYMYSRAMNAEATESVMSASLDFLTLRKPIGELMFIKRNAAAIDALYSTYSGWLRDGRVDMISGVFKSASLSAAAAPPAKENKSILLSLSGNHTEYHRAVEALANAEGINNLIYAKHIELSLPPGIRPMYPNPTYLTTKIDEFIPINPTF